MRGDERWERLFEELVGHEEPAWDEADLAELIVAERVGVRLVERLVGVLGAPISLTTTGGRALSGRLAGLADTWLVLSEESAEHLVVVAGIATVGPLGPPRPGSRAMPLGMALRRIATRGAHVVVDCGVEVRGHIVAVGADHLEVRGEGGSVTAVPTAALTSVRCAPGTFE